MNQQLDKLMKIPPYSSILDGIEYNLDDRFARTAQVIECIPQDYKRVLNAISDTHKVVNSDI
jgi:uncharacterized membrane-anchored protein YhcB (DUF1043 family)